MFPRSLDLQLTSKLQQVDVKVNQLNSFSLSTHDASTNHQQTLERIEHYTTMNSHSSASSMRSLDSVAESISRLESLLVIRPGSPAPCHTGSEKFFLPRTRAESNLSASTGSSSKGQSPHGPGKESKLQRTLSGSEISLTKSRLSGKPEFIMCSCCPKKPKRFESLEQLEYVHDHYR